MSYWLPVLSTLSGAIVAGAISYLLHKSANSHARSLQEMRIAEDRASWAVEQFRIQQARSVPDEMSETPDWVPNKFDAREKIESAIELAYLKILLFDPAEQERFREVMDLR